ncbi:MULTISPECIES: DUF3895 domain-containing protein [Niallia]|uniref:DUF3895 domain-containing protein n=1 Tax=Niallia TaxID=2837506 RepID=UPI0015F3A740|nr:MULTISPECIES: DUF3895 domain-containing protein [Niallia]GKU84115.1 hypothetical protein NCCP28_35110 [Niallia sp. NCCP-28]
MSQISFDDLFKEEKKQENTISEIPSPLQNDILELFRKGETNALSICEHLIKLGKFSDERFSTNKPKAYGKVCLALDKMTRDGLLIFVEDIDKKDRIYKLNC